jgi:hypothetical protein
MLTLAITGFEADPNRVTEILGVKPTTVKHAGIATLPSKRPARFNGWFFDAHPGRLSGGADHDRALDRIIELLKGREQRFAKLREEVQPETVGVYGGLHLRPNEQAGVWLDPAQMLVLANCQVEWGLDLFIR